MTTHEFPAGPIWVYKNRNAGPPRKAPRCICCFPGNRAGQIVPLKYGVHIALCDRHRDPAWMRSQSGRTFLSIVGTTFSSLGLKQPRFHEALDAFVRDLVAAERPPRDRPGSYAWPELRRALEGRWAEDSRFHACADAVSAYVAERPAGWNAPSAATLRRWWREKRWLLGGPPRAQPPSGSTARGGTGPPIAEAVTRRDRLVPHRKGEQSTVTEPPATTQPPSRARRRRGADDVAGRAPPVRRVEPDGR